MDNKIKAFLIELEEKRKKEFIDEALSSTRPKSPLPSENQDILSVLETPVMSEIADSVVIEIETPFVSELESNDPHIA